MKSRILKKLIEIEKNNDVKVIYACESGSRAWGFASEDSDYDVRFIYVHSKDWYLTIADKRDVIEIPFDGDLDINGWDIRKSLKLLRKSNSPLLEWLSSPIKYRNVRPVRTRQRRTGQKHSQKDELCPNCARQGQIFPNSSKRNQKLAEKLK
jgi:hypothetical protein